MGNPCSHCQGSGECLYSKKYYDEKFGGNVEERFSCDECKNGGKKELSKDDGMVSLNGHRIIYKSAIFPCSYCDGQGRI